MPFEQEFRLLALTLPGLPDAGIPAAAIRAGEIGVVNGEFAGTPANLHAALDSLRHETPERCGVRLDPTDPAAEEILRDPPAFVRWIVLASGAPPAVRLLVAPLRQRGLHVLMEGGFGACPQVALVPVPKTFTPSSGLQKRWGGRNACVAGH